MMLTTKQKNNADTSITTIARLNYRQFSTVLAALRLFQETDEEKTTSFDHFEDVDPLTDKQIDQLCESMNLDDATTPTTLLDVNIQYQLTDPWKSENVDGEPHNKNRAAWAGVALQAFALVVGEWNDLKVDPETVLCDLLADIRHWCDRNNVDFDCALSRGNGHYEAEVIEEQDLCSCAERSWFGPEHDTACELYGEPRIPQALQEDHPDTDLHRAGCVTCQMAHDKRLPD